MGYVNPADNSLMEASLVVSSAANKVQFNGTQFAGVSAIDDDEDDEFTYKCCVSDQPSKRSRIDADCCNLLSSSSSSSSSSRVSSDLSSNMSSREKSLLNECMQSIPASSNSRPPVFKFCFNNSK